MSLLVSVLIAAFNAEEHIARPVTSVIRQTYPHWEIIITDDDGKDYEKILHNKGIKDHRIRFTSTGKAAAGPSRARNAALDHAQGDIMATLDADDAFTPDKLEKLAPLAHSHGAVTSDIRIIQSETLEIFPSGIPPFSEGILSAADYIRANIHTYSILMWDRKRYEGRWDTSLFYAEDLIHGLSMYNTLDGIYYDPTTKHDYYKHKGTITYRINTLGLKSDPAFTMEDDLIALAQKGLLPVKNPEALDALIRFQTAWAKAEKKFFAEPAGDPVMGFYNFFRKNRGAFFDW
jgi:glycosyltransferase involved in cell wall biosynthesis